MTEVLFPYGKTKESYKFQDNELAGILTSSIEEYIPVSSGKELVKAAMAEPIGTPKLCEIAKDKQKIVIIASDHTRPVPSKIIMPLMLEEIRTGNDLSGSINELCNVFGENTTCLIEQAINKLKANGKYIGLSTGDLPETTFRHWCDMGIDMLSAGADFDFLTSGMQKTENNERNNERNLI